MEFGQEGWWWVDVDRGHSVVYSSILCNGDCIGSDQDIWVRRLYIKKWIGIECVGIVLRLMSHWKDAVNSFPMIYNMIYIDKKIIKL